MQLILKRAIQAIACVTLALTLTSTAQAADPSGTWTWTTPGRNGGPDRTSTLKLKTEGEKVTGTISAFRRDAEDIKISDGKIKDDEVSFKVTREGQNGTITQKYTGKVSGDTIKGKITFDRNGQETTRDWEAKRKKDEKKDEK